MERISDFAGFAANRGAPQEDTVRTLRRVAVRGRAGGSITLEFEGDGFLYRMVRLLTGSMVRCAKGRAPLEWFAGLLNCPGPRQKTCFAARPEGLYMVRVLYER